MTRPPRFTDRSRFRRPYVCAAESSKAGYLARRFRQIRADQKAEQAARSEFAEKVRSLHLMGGRK